MERLLVGTLDGIFSLVRSKDGWRLQGRALSGAEVSCLAVQPERRGTVFAGLRGGGLCRSTDGGQRWTRIGEGMLPDKIRALALDPSAPQRLYVGTEPAGLWRSEDEGRRWEEIAGVRELAARRRWTYPVEAIQPHVRSIAVDPRNPRKICLAAQVGGLVLSDDGGRSWTDERDTVDQDVHAVIFSAADSDTIYAATGGGEYFPNPTPAPKGRPLYRSRDGGNSWQSISDGFVRTYSVPIRVHPRQPEILFAGVAEQPPPAWKARSARANSALMKSCDSGATWEQLVVESTSCFQSMVECIEFDPLDPENLFIGTGGEGARFIQLTEGEIFHGTDGGAHWERIPVTLPIVFALAAL